MSDQSRSIDRMDHLDGLRGIAAVVVVVFHLMAAFLPDLIHDYQTRPVWFVPTPLSILWNGSFAVLVFFTLSGFILNGAGRRRGEPFWLRMGLRYLRLAVPAGLSVAIAWGLLTLFPTAATDLRAVTGSDWLRWSYQKDIPSLSAALFDGFVALFLWGGSFFNNALWTMRPELIGSALCFLLALPARVGMRVAGALVLAVAAILAGRPEYMCFALGTLLGEAQAAQRLRPVWAGTALCLGLILGSQAGYGAQAFGGIAGGAAGHPALHPLAAAAVIYGCVGWNPARVALSGTVPQFLGQISFPLYALHVPLLTTVLAQAYLSVGGEPVTRAVLFILWLAGLCALCYLAASYVEQPFIRALRRLRGALRRAPLKPTMGSGNQQC